jgi:hypothetical protein
MLLAPTSGTNLSLRLAAKQVIALADRFFA